MGTASKTTLHAWKDRLLDAVQRLAPDARYQPSAGALAAGQADFLPNFCSGPMVTNIVVIAEMLALVVTLVTRRISVNLFLDLLLISIFIQWIALTSAATLCATRRYLNRMSPVRALVSAYLLLLGVTLVIGELSVWVLWLAGKLPTPHPEWYAYFQIQNLSVSAVVNAVALRYLLAKHQLKQRTLSEAHAKIQALQSRIRPHFVFSSLNIIASLIRTAPIKAEGAIEDMADLFRMMLGGDETLVPVNREIDVAKKYLALEELRLENRLRVEWEIGKFPRKAVIPVLTLQPLLENAILHGIESQADGGAIRVALWEQDDRIHIQLTGLTGPARPHKRARAPGLDLEQGLNEMRLRFRSHYGEAATLEAQDGEQGKFVVNVVLPTRGGKA